MTESLEDIGGGYESDEAGNGQDDSHSISSSSIEEEHARLAEEYEEEDCGYEDENESVATSPSSLSGKEDEGEEEEEVAVMMEDVLNPFELSLDDSDLKTNEGQEPNFFSTLLKPYSIDRISSPEVIPPPSPDKVSDPLSATPRNEINGGGGGVSDGASTPEQNLSVIEKMKTHPSRRRIVGIVQNNIYRNSAAVLISTSKPQPISMTTANTSAASVAPHSTSSLSIPIPISSAMVKPQLDEPSDLYLEAKNLNLQSIDESPPSSPILLGAAAHDETGHNKSFNSTISTDTRGDGDDESGYAVDEENSFTNSQKSYSPVHVYPSTHPQEEAAAVHAALNESRESDEEVAESESVIEPESKSSSAFRFSSKLREGLDLIYRAASAAPLSSASPPSFLKQKGSANSLLTLAAKERYEL
jgi:hypothetical protein